MKTLRLLGAERRISVPHLAIVLGVALLLYTVVFCMWTRVSPWAVVRFLVAIVCILYFPGKLLVVAARLRLGPLEDWAVSLVLGMAASTGLYFICSLFGVRCLFPLWPLGATGFCLFRGARKWRSVVGCHIQLEMSRVLLAGLVALILVPLFFLPMFYRNMVLLPDGSMSYLDKPADPLAPFPIRLASAQVQELRRAVEGLCLRRGDADARPQQSPGQRFLSGGRTDGALRSPLGVSLICIARKRCSQRGSDEI